MKTLPKDIDPECIELCNAMNEMPGIETISSCCGHGKIPFEIDFRAKSLENLPALLYWFSACHSSIHGWEVIASTDCGMSPVVFNLRGNIGLNAYKEAARFAELIRIYLKSANKLGQ